MIIFFFQLASQDDEEVHGVTVSEQTFDVA